MNVQYLTRWHLGQEVVVEAEPAAVVPAPRVRSRQIEHVLFGPLILAVLYTMCLASAVLIPIVLAAFIADRKSVV